MKVTVTFFGDAPANLAEKMIQSVRKMDCEVIQLTDHKTPTLKGVDDVQRFPYEGDFGAFRLNHFKSVQGDVLHLDYDVIVNRDVSDVFKQDFDVGLTKRSVEDRTVSQQMNQVSPHNMGVVFSKNPEFWQRVYDHYMSIPMKSWMWIQIATTEAAHFLRDDFKVLELPGEVYNYTPSSPLEDVSQKAIVHYKGDRKHWMDESGKKGGELVRTMMSGVSQKIFYTEKHPMAKP
jgi:hypothetical protein